MNPFLGMVVSLPATRARFFFGCLFSVHLNGIETKLMGSKSIPTATSDAAKVPTNTPNAIKFLIGGTAG